MITADTDSPAESPTFLWFARNSWFKAIVTLSDISCILQVMLIIYPMCVGSLSHKPGPVAP